MNEPKKKIKIDSAIILLALMRFFVDCAYSIQAPFFPKILDEKGID